MNKTVPNYIWILLAVVLVLAGIFFAKSIFYPVGRYTFPDDGGAFDTQTGELFWYRSEVVAPVEGGRWMQILPPVNQKEEPLEEGETETAKAEVSVDAVELQ